MDELRISLEISTHQVSAFGQTDNFARVGEDKWIMTLELMFWLYLWSKTTGLAQTIRIASWYAMMEDRWLGIDNFSYFYYKCTLGCP